MTADDPLAGVEPVWPLKPRVTYSSPINLFDLFKEKTTTGRTLRRNEFPPDPEGWPQRVAEAVKQFPEDKKGELNEAVNRAARSRSAARWKMFRRAWNRLYNSRDKEGTGEPIPFDMLHRMEMHTWDWFGKTKLGVASYDVPTAALQEARAKGDKAFVRRWRRNRDLLAARKDHHPGVLLYEERHVVLVRNWVRFHDVSSAEPGFAWLGLEDRMLLFNKLANMRKIEEFQNVRQLAKITDELELSSIRLRAKPFPKAAAWATSLQARLR